MNVQVIFKEVPDDAVSAAGPCSPDVIEQELQKNEKNKAQPKFSKAKNLETQILKTWDFPCNHVHNIAEAGSYRAIEVCYENTSTARVQKIQYLHDLAELKFERKRMR